MTMRTARSKGFAVKAHGLTLIWRSREPVRAAPRPIVSTARLPLSQRAETPNAFR
jgi:hypothetical protein